MRLFNTLTQQIEPLAPRGNRVTLYVCGITPYDTTHLGHAFINAIYDTLVRYLRWRGLDVTYVQNVTDIDDDILRKAKQEGMAWDALGKRETERYLADLRALNVEMPTYYVAATDTIPEMTALIQALVEKGLAYERDGWVYYAVERDPQFGQLAEAAGYHGYAAWLETANERGNDPNDARKENSLDFVLWQAQQEEDEPAWPSPWGPGRPGWHIECSAMSTKYLGNQLDIHGGGADLMFPHHTCEIAQSENATGVRPFVRRWMHCAMVRLDGEKMSKSLGNLVLVRTLLAEGYSPDAIRALLLSHHYREEWEYNEEEMRASAALVARLVAAARLAEGDMSGAAEAELGLRQARLEFTAALEDDFHTEGALAVLDRLAQSVLIDRSAPCAAGLKELAQQVMGFTLTATPAQRQGSAAAEAAQPAG